jgi:hypothetical protein
MTTTPIDSDDDCSFDFYDDAAMSPTRPDDDFDPALRAEALVCWLAELRREIEAREPELRRLTLERARLRAELAALDPHAALVDRLAECDLELRAAWARVELEDEIEARADDAEHP